MRGVCFSTSSRLHELDASRSEKQKSSTPSQNQMSPSQIVHKPAPAPLPVPNPSKSFWHSEPSEFLLGHRTTEELPEYADVVIVGSGITGASAARYLAEEHVNWKIVMLEAREACWGATGRVSRAAFSKWHQSTSLLGITLLLLRLNLSLYHLQRCIL